jgi:7,8-dihydropterin-6-yl-methyl-4-(beta-D-ribofuranosyl)aminobenzene 5'-phosphate synthase
MDKAAGEDHACVKSRKAITWEHEMTDIKRREFLKASAALAAASAAGGFSCIEIASAAPISPPVVDRLNVRVLVDGAMNSFLRPAEAGGVKL